MKTNLLKLTINVQVPADWDAEKCNALRARHANDLPAGQAATYGPVDLALQAALDDLTAKLAAIDAGLTLEVNVQR